MHHNPKKSNDDQARLMATPFCSPLNTYSTFCSRPHSLSRVTPSNNHKLHIMVGKRSTLAIFRQLSLRLEQLSVEDGRSPMSEDVQERILGHAKDSRSDGTAVRGDRPPLTQQNQNPFSVRAVLVYCRTVVA